jgi:hypothetical protein
VDILGKCTSLVLIAYIYEGGGVLMGYNGLDG